MSRVETIEVTEQELEMAGQQSAALATRIQEITQELDSLRTQWWNGRHGQGTPAIDEMRRAAMDTAVAEILAGREPSLALLQSNETLEVRILACTRKLDILRPAYARAARRYQELCERQHTALCVRLREQLRPQLAEALRRLDDLTEFVRTNLFEPLAVTGADLDTQSLFSDDLSPDHKRMLWNTFGALLRAQDMQMQSGPRALELRKRRGLQPNGAATSEAA